MVNFVKPNLLGTEEEFANRFVNPIKNGKYHDSRREDIELMKFRSFVLHDQLKGCVQRQNYSVLAQFLPPKYEYVISIRLTRLQRILYRVSLLVHAGLNSEHMNSRTEIIINT